MKMARKQIKQILKERKEEVQLSQSFCGVMYGRGVASVAEQIHSTTEEAQKIVDDFYQSYPKIKEYTEYVQTQAKKNGFTQTAWGRRRYLSHIQDERYEYHYNDKRPVDFNPLFTAQSNVNMKVPQAIKDDYNRQLERANYNRKHQIIEKAKEEGIDIIDNSGYLADALRQCLNSTIQGEPEVLVPLYIEPYYSRVY